MEESRNNSLTFPFGLVNPLGFGADQTGAPNLRERLDLGYNKFLKEALYMLNCKDLYDAKPSKANATAKN